MARTASGWLAVGAGAIRLASGVSFLVAPAAANALWGGDRSDDSPTAALLLRSMGYRDALVGALLLRAGLRDDGQVPGWFLASAGADLADLVGGRGGDRGRGRRGAGPGHSRVEPLTDGFPAPRKKMPG